MGRPTSFTAIAPLGATVSPKQGLIVVLIFLVLFLLGVAPGLFRRRRR